MGILELSVGDFVSVKKITTNELTIHRVDGIICSPLDANEITELRFTLFSMKTKETIEVIIPTNYCIEAGKTWSIEPIEDSPLKRGLIRKGFEDRIIFIL